MSFLLAKLNVTSVNSSVLSAGSISDCVKINFKDLSSDFEKIVFILSFSMNGNTLHYSRTLINDFKLFVNFKGISR